MGFHQSGMGRSPCCDENMGLQESKGKLKFWMRKGPGFEWNGSFGTNLPEFEFRIWVLRIWELELELGFRTWLWIILWTWAWTLNKTPNMRLSLKTYYNSGPFLHSKFQLASGGLQAINVFQISVSYEGSILHLFSQTLANWSSSISLRKSNCHRIAMSSSS